MKRFARWLFCYTHRYEIWAIRSEYKFGVHVESESVKWTVIGMKDALVELGIWDYGQ